MKNEKKKFYLSLSVLMICFLISASSLNTLSLKALVEEKYNHYNTDSFDRSTWIWNTTEVVSTESTCDSDVPALAVDAAGNVLIAWEDDTDFAGAGTDSDIFYKRWDTSTSSWTTTEVVSTESTSDSWDSSLAVDAAGNVHIAWLDDTDYASSGTDYDIFYKYWDASTSIWTITEVVSTESTENSYTPSLYIDTLGNVHIAWEDFTDYAGAGTDLDIFYKYWNASTSSWNATEVVSTESTSVSQCPSIAIDTFENVHVAWLDDTDYASSGTDGDVFYKRWDTSTSSWTTTEVVSTESTDHSAYSTSLAVDTAGNIHIEWVDYTDYAGSGVDTDIFYKRWNASTSIWTITEVVSTESTATSLYSSLAVDTAGNVHIAWEDLTEYAGAGTDLDIFYKYWNASTSSWNATEVVSTESTSFSWFPSLAVDSTGYIHIAWVDETNYAGAGTDRDIFYKLFAGLPIAPYLSPILPNPTDIAAISLDWNDVPATSSYYIYRSTANILSVEGLTPIGNTVTTSYDDILPAEGLYFYVIVANNFVGNSTLSNCESVDYELPVVYEFGAISGLMFATFAFLIVILRTRKKKLKWTSLN